MKGSRPLRWAVMAVVLFAVVMLLQFPQAAAAGGLDIMRVKEVAPGIKGIGLTVVQGTTIEEFAVEVLGVLDGSGRSRAMVLVRVSGPLIERSGGIAAGMSGSPVYIDGRLLGAIAYGFDMADHNLGLLTPVEDMVELEKLLGNVSVESAAAPRFPAGVEMAGKQVRGVALAPNPVEAAAWRGFLPNDVAVAVPVATPLMAQGLSARTMRMLSQVFARWNMRVLPGGGAASDAATVPLTAGASLGIQLVRGDVNMTAIGTVTYVTPEGRFTAFGHPFLNRGRVNYFATGATVLQTVHSIETPFKLGQPLEPVGRLLQDRSAGVAGVLGDDPPSIDVEVYVKDRVTGRETDFYAQVVRDEDLAAPLVAITILEALDRGIDRIGKGSAQIITRVELAGRNQMITRHNMFYGAGDVAGESLGEFVYALQRLLHNDIAAVQVNRIVLEADISEARNTAYLEEVRAPVTDVKPGDTINTEVVLRPYRQDPVTLVMMLTIPKEAPAGPATVFVQGGGDGSPPIYAEDLAEELEAPTAGDVDQDYSVAEAKAEDMEKLLVKLFEQDRNYEVVMQLYANEMSLDELSQSAESEQGTGVRSKAEKESLEKVKVKLPTAWVIEGFLTFDINIVEPDSAENPEQAGNEPESADSNIKQEEPLAE